MGTVYPLDAGRNLIIYESGNMLYIRTTIGEGLTRPVTLCTDYGGSLSDTVHNGTVYYCYRNTGGDIVVRSITDLQELYRIDSRDISDCMNPRLVSFRDTLLLFYVIKNPIDDAYSLKCLFPFDVRRHVMLPEKCFQSCPEVNILYSEEHMLVYAWDDASQLLLLFDAGLGCSVLDADGESAGQILTLRQSLAELEEQLAERDRIIESIKVQYAELMDTALKYKAEAARWYETAHKKDSRPIPGESLISDNW